MDNVLKTHHFNFNKKDNGGEAFVLDTKVVANGDSLTDGKGYYLAQKLTLHSYSNSAGFELSGATLTPALLRKLADELEAVIKEVTKTE